ncbi:aspartyl protease family protein [Hymenobacter sp. ASUV-10]|uniref:Aspartyl protease family protein n=1 Tax=Hymenobacter aranciens TaxID=3063996 RepID=A0ABT9BEL0_9BACT|nr:aspartyl protease family protein [Hymenobacter sp. ASUV-10]MDO7876205.1 aspartyl protease family protein [Hymenobacter sp. ASUV-10]
MLALRRICVLLLLLCGSAAEVWAQPATGPFHLLRPTRKRVRLPFQQQRNFIIVSAKINGTGPYNFLLDTGAGTSIITSPHLADSLGLRRGEKFRVIGAGGQTTSLLAYQLDNLRLTMPGIEAPAMSMLVLSEDVLNLSGYVGMPIHGILGPEFFHSFVVTVLPQQSMLVLQPSAAFQAPRSPHWASLPLQIERSKAYVTVPVHLSDSLQIPLKLVIDTGAGHALSLETGSHPQLQLPPQQLPAELGRGLTGVVRGQLGRVAELRLGHYQLRSVLTSFPDVADVHGRADVHRNGNLGFESLKRFAFTIDYSRQRLWLRPNLHFNEPFEHDMSGLDLLAVGPNLHRFLVLRVAPGSPAAEAGIQPDEELVSVNFMAASAFSLTQISHLLHSSHGRSIILVLRRADGELHTAIVRLKRQI